MANAGLICGGKKKKNIYRDRGYVLPVEYLRKGKRYLISVSTIGTSKCLATNFRKSITVGLIILEILVLKNDEFSSFSRCEINKFDKRSLSLTLLSVVRGLVVYPKANV